MAGDRIHTKVDYFYQSLNADNSTTNTLANIVNSIINTLSISGTPAAIFHNESSAVGDQLNNDNSFANAVDAAANTKRYSRFSA